MLGVTSAAERGVLVRGCPQALGEGLSSQRMNLNSCLDKVELAQGDRHVEVLDEALEADDLLPDAHPDRCEIRRWPAPLGERGPHGSSDLRFFGLAPVVHLALLAAGPRWALSGQDHKLDPEVLWEVDGRRRLLGSRARPA